MIELLSALPTWQPALRGDPCAVATVVGASGSVPRPVGTSMLVASGTPAPHVLGSLSGGCVEGAVVAAALDVLESGAAASARFGYSAEDAFAVGLTCGGEVEVHIAPLPAEVLASLAAHDAGGAASAPGVPCAVVRRLDPTHDGAGGLALLGPAECAGGEALATALETLFPGAPQMAARAAALVEPIVGRGSSAVVAVATEGACELRELDGRGDVGVRRGDLGGVVRLLVESRLPAPRFMVVGANDFGAALVPAARLLGYRVTLVDARPAFAAQERFACADEIAVARPHEYLVAEARAGRLDARTAVAVLSHDPKFDIPLLDAALRLDLAYVGAMGSRRSHEQRIAALLEAGHGPVDLGRLRSPIGLDLGAVAPAEVAVAILAELVAARHPGAGCGPLRDRRGHVHAARPAAPDPQEVTPRREGEEVVSPWT
ncbi:XdhC family protein [Sinomonas sp. R1AF57]|uniref:XdhC family protein n=1 Tax=Sinomonas sp. R1AF57 TaxID=2020377 RepID=UPI000B5FC034|nr:XdhC/CoxI family protein [Sinomonas sp. R1AF57]ASN52851.1 xanthine dehydrogenase [Sinomonas sp. R1AF57]